MLWQIWFDDHHPTGFLKVNSQKLRFAGRYSTQDPSPKIHMAPGHFQTIYLTSSGSVYDFGSDNLGQLGDGLKSRDGFLSTPYHVTLPGPMKQVGSGMGTCWAVSADGRTAYAWGDNSRGQLGIGKPSVKYATTPVKIDFDLPKGVTIASMTDGLKEEYALLSNGQVMAWGDNRFGQCGLDPKTRGAFIYKPTVDPHLKDVSQLVAGDYYAMALKKNGTVFAWGQDTNGELGRKGPTGAPHAHSFRPVRVTDLPKIQNIVAGGKNGIAVDKNGHVWEWGRDKFGELGRGSADLADGAHPTPKMVAGLPPVVSLDSEGPTVLAADAQGEIYSWGFDKWGAVGDGNTANTGTPHLVLTMATSPNGREPSVQVAAAHRSSYAYNVVTGQTYAWGENNLGQIGIPANKVPNPVPIDISSEIQPTLDPVCFCAQTRIRTSRGDQPIETLAIGDFVVTTSGTLRSIKWLGHRAIDCRCHPNPAAVLPVRIAAHAFGENRPIRELLVSLGHAICIDACGEMLITAGTLVNGTTVAQVAVDAVDYWHVELGTHDILLAENLACESYLEMGNRTFFSDQAVVALHASPDLPAATHDDFCRPFVSDGPIVGAVRRQLNARAERLVDDAAARRMA